MKGTGPLNADCSMGEDWVPEPETPHGVAQPNLLHQDHRSDATLNFLSQLIDFLSGLKTGDS